MQTFGREMQRPGQSSSYSDSTLNSWPGFLSFPVLQQQMSEARSLRAGADSRSRSTLPSVTSLDPASRYALPPVLISAWPSPQLNAAFTTANSGACPVQPSLAPKRSFDLDFNVPKLSPLDNDTGLYAYPSPVSQIRRNSLASVGTDCPSLVSNQSWASIAGEHVNGTSTLSHRGSIDSIDLLIQAAADWQHRSTDPDLPADQYVDPLKLDRELDRELSIETDDGRPGTTTSDFEEIEEESLPEVKLTIGPSPYGAQTAPCHWCGRVVERRRLKRGVTFVVGR